MARRDAQHDSLTDLVHPVYLDVPMLVSFLAAVDNGISFRSEVAEKVATAAKNTTDVSGKVGLPSLTSLLGLSLSASGRYNRDSSGEESVDSRFVREHTAASLFNIFRRRLVDEGLVVLNEAEQITQEYVAPGTLVEITGEVLGNPLRQTLDLFVALAPFFGLSLEEPKADQAERPRAQQRKQGGKGIAQLPQEPGGPSPEVMAEFMRHLIRDAQRSPVVDLQMSSGQLNAVLTVSREYLSPEGEADLLSGYYSVIGKLTATLGPHDELNLLRRTALGYGGRKLGQSLFSDFISPDNELDIKLASPTVKGPAVQILPLAIFI